MADDTYVLNELVTGSATVTITDIGDEGNDTIKVNGIYLDYVAITLEWTSSFGVPTSASGLYTTNSGGHRLVIEGAIENVLGSDGRDYIQGNSLNNQLIGDTNINFGGDDTIFGGAGADYILCGLGNDSVGGGDDSDEIYGGAGMDTIYGGAGVDWIIGGAGADVMSGGSDFHDYIDYRNSGSGIQVDITYGSTTTGHGGQAEGDQITGFTDMTGSAFDDVVTDPEKSTIASGMNANTFEGLGGNDRLVMGGGNDSAFGSNGNDTILGEFGRDHLVGGNGNDSVSGGGQADYLTGEGGNDVLNGDLGADTMMGGFGADTFVFSRISDLSTAAPFNKILDFRHTDGDLIDLHSIDAKSGVIGNQSFTYIGSDAFGVVKGQLRSIVVGADTRVSGDVNGDGNADFVIVVHLWVEITPLVAADFVL